MHREEARVERWGGWLGGGGVGGGLVGGGLVKGWLEGIGGRGLVGGELEGLLFVEEGGGGWLGFIVGE